jgi:Secretion system C-terminal sorting domain
MKKVCLLFIAILCLSINVLFAQTVINFSQENAVQNWAVPAGITTVTITVTGAAGGGTPGQGAGGNGASLTGVCTVIPGHKLSIVVGSMGGGNVATWACGGGGASYVYDSNTVTLLIAGAGGGGGSSAPGYNGAAGGTNISTNVTTAEQYDGNGGTGGNGGNPDSAGNDAAGGAGWISNGINGSFGADGGNDRINLFGGGAGALPGQNNNNGGYGGGGGGGNDGGGGGGGYNGGGGGAPGSGGGGGGSYLNGTVVGTPIANNRGNGHVSIKYSGAAGINDITSNEETISLYPNPSSGEFTIQANGQQLMANSYIEIYNMLGEKVYSNSYQPIAKGYQLSLSSQPVGMYFYRITTQDGDLVGEGKLIIKK